MKFGFSLPRRIEQATSKQGTELGVIYEGFPGTDFANYTEISPNGSFTVNGTDVVASRTGTGDLYGDYLFLDTVNGEDYYTSIEKWTCVMIGNITAQNSVSYGTSIGTLSFGSQELDAIMHTTYSDVNLGWLFFSMMNTKVLGVSSRVYNKPGSGLDESVYWHEFKRDINVWTLSTYQTTIDASQPSGYARGALLNTGTFTSNPANKTTQVLPNLSRFAVVHHGGEFNVKYLKFSSHAYNNADYLWIGDSNDAGYGLSAISDRVQNLLFTTSSFENIVGSYNTSSDYVRLIPQLKTFCLDTHVVIAGWTNDLVTSIPEATTISNLNALATAIVSVDGNRGFTVIGLRPSNAFDVTSRNDALRNECAANGWNFVDVFIEPYKDSVSTNFASGLNQDNYHRNEAGAIVEADIIRAATGWS